MEHSMPSTVSTARVTPPQQCNNVPVRQCLHPAQTSTPYPASLYIPPGCVVAIFLELTICFSLNTRGSCPLLAPADPGNYNSRSNELRNSRIRFYREGKRKKRKGEMFSGRGRVTRVLGSVVSAYSQERRVVSWAGLRESSYGDNTEILYMYVDSSLPTNTCGLSLKSSRFVFYSHNASYEFPRYDQKDTMDIRDVMSLPRATAETSTNVPPEHVTSSFEI
ncbi:hypothetical protein J6590_043812 [Homalodisca vitripennis]|nr:hypothetical protein J6590_043812 [Homalodisca vitripennis]